MLSLRVELKTSRLLNGCSNQLSYESFFVLKTCFINIYLNIFLISLSLDTSLNQPNLKPQLQNFTLQACKNQTKTPPPLKSKKYIKENITSQTHVAQWKPRGWRT